MHDELFSDAELRNKKIDALKCRLRSKLAGYTLAFKNVLVGTRIYRGVPWPERPSRIEQLWHPPAERARRNRANRDGRPMFYGSAGAPAVFYELRAKHGDRIALSEWEIAEPLYMHNLGYHEAALAKIGAPDANERANIYNLIPGESMKNAKLRRLLSLAFTEDIRDGREYRYKQSIAIHELLFDGADPVPQMRGGPRSTRVAGTVYPAVRMLGAADNVVIWPDFVMSSLRLKTVRYVLVEEANQANFSYTVRATDFAKSFSGSDIVWLNPVPPEFDLRSRIALEGDEWVMRDGLDNVYDRHPAR